MQSVACVNKYTLLALCIPPSAENEIQKARRLDRQQSKISSNFMVKATQCSCCGTGPAEIRNLYDPERKVVADFARKGNRRRLCVSRSVGSLGKIHGGSARLA